MDQHALESDFEKYWTWFYFSAIIHIAFMSQPGAKEQSGARLVLLTLASCGSSSVNSAQLRVVNEANAFLEISMQGCLSLRIVSVLDLSSFEVSHKANTTPRMSFGLLGQ